MRNVSWPRRHYFRYAFRPRSTRRRTAFGAAGQVALVSAPIINILAMHDCSPAGSRQRVFLSEESRAQIQPVAREEQRHEQAHTAKNDKHLERFDINIDSRYAGESSCDSSHFPPPGSASGRGSVDAVVARLVICACALDHSWRLPTPLSPVHDGRAFTSAPLSPRFRSTAEGRGKIPTPVLRQRFLRSAIIIRLLTHAPVGKRFGMGGPRSRRRSPGAASNLLFGHVGDAHGPTLADARKDRRGVPFRFGLEQNRTLGFASISTASVELLQATRPFGAPHGPETKQATYRLNWDTRSHELGHESLGLIDFVALCPTWDCTSSPHY